jgi:uncharacterized protein YggU (UPF0235/DUF167 family)
VDSRANQLLIDFIAKKLDVPSSRVRLRRGGRSRAKLIEVLAPGEDALRSLSDWDAGWTTN